MANDKFIMIDLDDERSKNIAEVLGNKTCKKLIDYLSEVKEASEKDISDALSIPINTVEYNLNKLIKTGLIEKTKNFFWSRKGKKIDMYKLAKKHIVISPKPRRVDMKELRAILPVIFIAAAIIVIAALFMIPRGGDIPGLTASNDTKLIPGLTAFNDTKLKQFSSYDELKNFLALSLEDSQGGIRESTNALTATTGVSKASVAPSTDSAGGGSASLYSQTNIQVEGVDEADIVKNDGKYIYTLSGNKVVIVNAYPANSMKITSEIKFSSASNIFVNENKLIVFGNSYEVIPYEYDSVRCLGSRCGGSQSRAKVYIYDISDRENPILERNMSFDGNYVDSRMIGDYVYIISSKYVNAQSPELPVYSVNGDVKDISLSNLYYSPYVDSSYVFTSISSINVNEDEINSKVYLTGSTNEVYVSENNIYLTYQKSVDWQDYNDRMMKEVYLAIVTGDLKDKIQDIIDSSSGFYEKQNKISKLISTYSMSLKGIEKEEFDSKLQKSLTDFQTKIEKERDKSVVHKINVNKINIEYKTAGEFPGHVLNQFSMDEYDGNFRVATTTGQVWGGNSLNHVYVLDEELNVIGKLEDLAHGEKIYSARFIGSRAYVVTFKKVDPLFVIDLSSPENPTVLGYLKIPGYSDYLHPYDENHVIGIGKEAIDASLEEVAGRNLDFAWYQGVKISLFDVTDVEHPIEKAKYIIGDRGTDSPALSDHKALLFDKEKKILVLPISLAEINESKYGGEIPVTAYGEHVWQGVYVLNIDLEGISLRGKISHNKEVVVKYGAAKDELIGAERIDRNGIVWTKVNIQNDYGYNYGKWESTSIDYPHTYSDYNIDTFPGGINYNPRYDYSSQIKRSLYMDDVLYTVSQSKIKANDLNTIEEIKSLDLGYKE